MVGSSLSGNVDKIVWAWKLTLSFLAPKAKIKMAGRPCEFSSSFEDGERKQLTMVLFGGANIHLALHGWKIRFCRTSHKGLEITCSKTSSTMILQEQNTQVWVFPRNHEGTDQWWLLWGEQLTHIYVPTSMPDPTLHLFFTLVQGCEMVAHNELTSRKVEFRGMADKAIQTNQLEQTTRKPPCLLFPLVAQYCIYPWVILSKKKVK